MTDGDSLLHAVLLDPDDDVVRLVYADWLDEHGQPERAEFIRLGLESAALACEYAPEFLPCPQRHGHSSAWCDACTRGEALRRRAHSLQAAHGREWRRPVEKMAADSGVMPSLRPHPGCEFRRGFVEKITVAVTAAFVREGAASAVFGAHPITGVTFPGKHPGETWHADRACFWSRGGDGPYNNAPWDLLPCLFDLLRREPGCLVRRVLGFGEVYAFADAVAALAVLSRVAVTWGRGQAGLPTLTAVPGGTT